MGSEQHAVAVFDSLEPRALFSSAPIANVPTYAVHDDGTLILSGTSGDDNVTLRSNANGVVIRLNEDGSARKRYAPGGIKAVKFDGGSGDDRLTVDSNLHFVTATKRVEERTVKFSDGTETNDFSLAAQPGFDQIGGQEKGRVHWLQRFRRQQKALAAQNAGVNPRTLFIGDSLTERMPHQGAEEWRSLEEKFDAEDLGFSGDTTTSLLYRLQHDLIKGLWPKTIFVSIGTNNIALTDDVTSTIRGIRRVLGKLKDLRPKSDIVLSGILPRGSGDGEAKTVDAVNDRLDDLAKEFDAVFSDAAAAFPDVKLKPRDFEKNSVHLTRFGYAKWAPVIADSLRAAQLTDD